MAAVRPAAVAGTFYPGEPRALAAEVDDLLGGVEQLAPRLGFPKALIVPHAGYIYSGPVAARAYDELAAARGIVRRVVMLGPVHRVPVRGLALPGADAFATPLGTVPIDRDALRALHDLPQVVRSDPAHALEHSLEVQLPFLQKVLGDFALVPFAVGMANVEEVAQVIERLWGGRETLIVISTDLSHYHAYEEARRIDGSTVDRIAAFATDIDHEEACGATPLNGLLSLAKKKNLSIRLLAACNSGDTAGGKGQVVGYSSFALYEGGEVKHADAGSTLISIASGSISSGLGLGPPPSVDGVAWLDQAGATFVTLLRERELRGCVGSLEAARPIGADVADNALGAAFRDPRFPALTRDEWPLCSVEVSLLSAPKPIQFADEDHLLALICAGEDGLILEADGRRATFLPQVWESIADTRRFVDELKRKAGIPASTRLGRCKVARYRVIKWKETRTL
ncbi:MAG TPA: AmmeMemoRadiSam system protein B [Burkholderiales bacterium]|nr:AmmeMemoRadiSam system protein B [Burkholderiales bacterium]